MAPVDKGLYCRPLSLCQALDTSIRPIAHPAPYAERFRLLLGGVPVIDPLDYPLYAYCDPNGIHHLPTMVLALHGEGLLCHTLQRSKYATLSRMVVKK
jgi:hypothetical protein